MARWVAGNGLAYGRGVSIADSGATVGAADNATAIQAAIDAMATAGGGTVYVPKGTWTTGPLVMKTGVRLLGEHQWGTTLKLKNSANAHFVTCSAQAYWVTIENITLDGNKANQTSGDVVHFDQSSFTPGALSGILDDDPNHHFTNVILTNGKGAGYFHTGPRGACLVNAVFSYDCDGRGFDITSPDNSFIGCISAGAGYEGFYISASQNGFVGCKAFISGQITDTRGAGFQLESAARNDLIRCEAQDNRAHGFVLVGVVDTMLIGKSERNGLGAGATPPGGAADGVYAFNVKNSRIDLNITDRNVGGLKQRWGYNCAAGSNDGNIVTLTIGNTQTGTIGLGSWGANSIVSTVFNGLAVPNAVSPVPQTAQTGTTYTFVMADAGTVVEGSNAAAQTYTMPPNSSVAFPVGAQVVVRQMGAGQITLAPGAGVTLRSRGSALKIAGQYGEAVLTKRGTDEWVVSGDLA